VSIPASDVAAVVGRNEYKAPSEVFEVLWKRYAPDTFTGTTRIDEELKAFKKCSDKEKESILAAAGHRSRDANDAGAQIDLASAVISESALSQDDQAKVQDMLRRNVSTGFGRVNENVVVQHVSVRDKVSFTRETAMLSLPLCHINGTEYAVRGKIDRLQEEKVLVPPVRHACLPSNTALEPRVPSLHPPHTPSSAPLLCPTSSIIINQGELLLVEVKSRMKRLFKEVRPYEAVQMQMYLQMLPKNLNIKRAKLLEMYNGETHEEYVEKDDAMWQDELKPALVKFCVDLDQSMKAV
jgi:hypothetical protein